MSYGITGWPYQCRADVAAFPRPKLRAGAGEVCALPARQPAQYLQVLPRLFPAACLCLGQACDVARIVVNGRQIGDDVPDPFRPPSHAQSGV